MRYAITPGIVFDSNEPEYLLIQYGEEGFGRLIGQFHKLEDAFVHLHERVGTLSDTAVKIIELGN